MFFSWLITASGGDWPWQLLLQLLQLDQERRLSFDVVAPGPQAADVGDGIDIPSQHGDIMGIHYIYIWIVISRYATKHIILIQIILILVVIIVSVSN